MWSYDEAIIELAAAIFMKRLQQHGHEFRDETKLLAKAGERCLQENLLQSTCQYDVTSRVSDFQNGEQSVHRRDG